MERGGILPRKHYRERPGKMLATPAIIDDTLLVRTERRLYAITAPGSMDNHPAALDTESNATGLQTDGGARHEA